MTWLGALTDGSSLNDSKCDWTSRTSTHFTSNRKECHLSLVPSIYLISQFRLSNADTGMAEGGQQV